MEKNYYKILEVDSSASQEVIEKAYKALAKKYHPDLQEDSQKKQAEEKLKEINEAYEVLSDPASREKYDVTLKNSTPSEEDMERISRENQKLQNELNNLKHSSNQGYNNFVNQNYNNNYNPNGNNVRNQAEIQRQMQQEMQEKEYQRQLEYEAQMQAARQKAYHDAYIQDLKNRGYKIKYKKTPKEIFKNFLSLLITFVIVIILLQIPIVKRFFINLYNGNPLIQSIVDVFIKKSN